MFAELSARLFLLLEGWFSQGLEREEASESEWTARGTER